MIKKELFCILAATLIFGAVMTQTPGVDLEIYATSTDYTTVNLNSLFAAPTKSLKTNGLGQTTYTWNTSHPAATIQTFGEVKFSGPTIDLSTYPNVDFWTYDPNNKIVHVVSNGVYSKYNYIVANHSLTLNISIPVSVGTVCTGFDYTSKLSAIGCLNGTQAELYTIVNNAVADHFTLAFETDRQVVGRLRVDLTTDNDYLSVFDDAYIATNQSTNMNAVYFLATQANGTLTYYNSITQVGNSNMTTLNEINIMVTDTGDYKAYVSFVDSNSGNFEVNECDFNTNDVAKTASLDNCDDKGISDLNVKVGRAEYFTSTTSPYIVVFNNTDPYSPSITHCLYDDSTQKFSDCLSTIRSLPFTNGQNVTSSGMTNYNGNIAIYFQDNQTGQRWAVLRIRRYQATSTMAVQYDSVEETSQRDTLVVEANDAIVLFQGYTKFYGRLQQSQYTLQIKSQDIPVPANSNVYLKRALIQVTQTPSQGQAVTKLVRVVVLNTMNAYMGFADQLPDFGGVLGGSQFTNMDRTWVYGNNLQVSLQSSALNQPVVFDRMDFTYTYTPAVTLTRVILKSADEVIGQDATSLYYFTCAEGATDSRDCTQKSKVALPVGFWLNKVYDTTDYPYNDQATAIISVLTDVNGNVKLWYIWKSDLTKSTLVDFQAGTTYRDVHVINYMDTLIWFTAPTTAQDKENVVVVKSQNTPAGFNTISAIGTITPAEVGFPPGFLSPNRIKSCGHNDYVVEFLTGNGYIAKFNVVGTTAQTINLRAVARITDRVVANFTAQNFCPFGDEFLVWDNNGRVFSKSTGLDNSFYEFHLHEFGFVSVFGVNCSRYTASAGVWGKDQNGNVLLATIYGNQFSAAHSKIHSVITMPFTSNPTYTGTFEMSPSGIAHVAIADGVTYTKHIVLAGPYLMTGFSQSFTDPNLNLQITSGNETRTLTKQLNMQAVNFNVSVTANQKIDFTTGTLNIEQSASIVGHVATATLSVPQSLQGIVTLQDRNALVDSSYLKGTNAVTLSHVLGSSSNCVLYTSRDSSTGFASFSLRGTGCTRDYVTNITRFTSVDGRVEADQAVVVGAYRIGGMDFTIIYYIPLDVTTDVIILTNSEDRGYIASVKVIRVPGIQVTHAVFANVKIHNRVDVLKASRDKGTFVDWDSISNVVNIWPINTSDAGMVFYNNYKDTTLNLYVLPTQGATAGQTQNIALDGNNNEFLDVRCISPAGYTITCGLVTYGANVIVLNINFDNKFNIPDGGLYTSALFNYAENADTGSYDNLDIIPGYIVLQGMDGYLDVYKTTNDGQGYLYTRIPAHSSFKRSLKLDIVHRSAARTYAIQALPNNTTSVIRVGSSTQGNDVAQLQEFSIQPLAIIVSQAVNADANQIKLSIGSSSQPVQFPITQFFNPKVDPKPSDKDGLGWYWIWIILLGFAVILGVGSAVYFFVIKKKERGAEDEAYYDKKEPFVDEKPKAERKNSDEFN